jgi:hypothetical protein
MSKSDSTYAGLVSHVIYKVPNKNHELIFKSEINTKSYFHYGSPLAFSNLEIAVKEVRI